VVVHAAVSVRDHYADLYPFIGRDGGKGQLCLLGYHRSVRSVDYYCPRLFRSQFSRRYMEPKVSRQRGILALGYAGPYTSSNGTQPPPLWRT